MLSPVDSHSHVLCAERVGDQPVGGINHDIDDLLAGKGCLLTSHIKVSSGIANIDIVTGNGTGLTEPPEGKANIKDKGLIRARVVFGAVGQCRNGPELVVPIAKEGLISRRCRWSRYEIGKGISVIRTFVHTSEPHRDPGIIHRADRSRHRDKTVKTRIKLIG